MPSKSNFKLDTEKGIKIDPEKEKQNVLATLNLLQYMKKDIRFLIIIHLAFYGKLSLNQLSDQLKVAKGTITNHITPLVKNNIVKITEKKIRGPIQKKFYELSLEYLSLKLSWHQKEDLITIPVEEYKNLLSKYIEIDNEFLELMSMIFSNILPKSDIFRKRIQEHLELDADPITILNDFYKNKIHHFFYLLDNEEAQIYAKHAKKFQTEFEAELSYYRNQNSQNTAQNEGRTHIAWNILMPYFSLIEKNA